MSDLDRMLSAVRSGRLSRRAFLQRGLALGLSATAVGTLLSACGEEEEEQPAAMDTTLPEKIDFFNWADYIDPDLKKKFEQETGIKVAGGLFDSNDDLLGKLQSRRRGLRRHLPRRLHRLDLAQVRHAAAARHVDLIPSFSGSSRRCRSPSSTTPTQQDGHKYSVPYMFGNAGIGVRTDKVSDAGHELGHDVGPRSTRARSRC